MVTVPDKSALRPRAWPKSHPIGLCTPSLHFHTQTISTRSTCELHGRSARGGLVQARQHAEVSGEEDICGAARQQVRGVVLCGPSNLFSGEIRVKGLPEP